MCRSDSQTSPNIGCPEDKTLPFFAYGFFKKGELAYNLIKNSVDGEPVEDRVRGELYNKDGIPIFTDRWSKGFSIGGNIIRFKDINGYKGVCSIEPGELYKWDVVRTENGVEVNILVALSDNVEGAEQYNEGTYIDWHGNNDPFFKYGMTYLEKVYFDPLVEGTWESNQSKMIASTDPEVKKLYEFFELQMAYVFLWSIIDRYCTFRYRLTPQNTGKKSKGMAEDDEFIDCCREIPNNIVLKKVVNSANFFVRRGANPRSASCLIDNLYTIRNNAVHRGKAIFGDVKKLEYAFLILYGIMHSIFAKEFTGEYDHKKIKTLEKFR